MVCLMDVWSFLWWGWNFIKFTIKQKKRQKKFDVIDFIETPMTQNRFHFATGWFCRISLLYVNFVCFLQTIRVKSIEQKQTHRFCIFIKFYRRLWKCELAFCWATSMLISLNTHQHFCCKKKPIHPWLLYWLQNWI